MKKVSLCIAAAMSSFSGFAQPKDGKSNIIFFLVDDMGWQETSVPFWKEKTMLNERYHTPNMEILASQGMKFTQAYACPLSSPTRVSLMTGLNAARHGVTNWTLRKNISPDQNHKILEMPFWNVNGISPFPGVENTRYVSTLPMFLKGAGYTTIHVGKAHWGAKDTPGEDPLKLGFDVNVAGHAAGGPGSYHGMHNFSAAWRSTSSADLIWDVPGLEKYHGKDISLTEAGSEPYSVIRKGDWKLIYWYLDGKTELYNIPDDISESKDLSSSHPEITERLANELGNSLKSVGAKAPVDKSTKIACPFPGDL